MASREDVQKARLELDKQEAHSKRHDIAQELLSSEKIYVEHIKCIAVDFCDLVKEFNVKYKQAIPMEKILLNIYQIYKLHEKILEGLQRQMDTRETHEGLGDLMAQLAPFFKLYTPYTMGFEDAMKTLTEWTNKNKRFGDLVREFELTTLPMGLSVTHYMFEPIQRILSYQLCMADYLKYLPADSPDRASISLALDSISKAADHAKDLRKELENSNEILAIHRSLTKYEGRLMSPSRVYIRKGELRKVSRNSETCSRMFFLFSDILLHTKPSGHGTYEFRDEMSIVGMTVEDPKNPLIPHSFNVYSTTRALILVASCEEEKLNWMTALKEVIPKETKKRQSLKRNIKHLSDSGNSEFGIKAPIMVPDKSVTMCQTCDATFTFINRRHHCRACGKVVCGDCSQEKAFLAYKGKMEKVCQKCKFLSKEIIITAPVASDLNSSGVLKLKSMEDDTIIADYVQPQNGTEEALMSPTINVSDMLESSSDNSSNLSSNRSSFLDDNICGNPDEHDQTDSPVLTKGQESSSRSSSFFKGGIPVLPQSVVSDRETNRPVYQSSISTDVPFTPHGYPLRQTPLHPNVTFYDEPEKREFPSTGGHTDFNNGVEITIPLHTNTSESVLEVKVQPSFAPNDSVFVLPEGIQSASPSYLISCDDSADLKGEVTVTMEHHKDAPTSEEADELVFLQADPTPDEEGAYKYREASDGRSEFTPGENKGKHTMKKLLSKMFWKIGSKIKKLFKTDHNLYTVRVYRSPAETTSDVRLAIICVCLFGKVYSKFLETLDKKLIPQDYPEVSTKAADRTTQSGLRFEEKFAALHIGPLQGWTVEADKERISKVETDLPETGKFNPADLHDYPPRIICRLYPEENAPQKTTCSVALTGMRPEVKVHVPLNVRVVVDTANLQTAVDQLRTTAHSVSHPQLGSAVDKIVSLADRLTEALRLSSLSGLNEKTDLIKAEVKTVITVSSRVASRCTRCIIRENIEDNLSRIKTLSHQLVQVTQVRLRHCQDESEKRAALIDLAENGTGLMKILNSLLRNMRTLLAVDGSDVLTIEALQRKTGVSNAQLGTGITEQDLSDLAACFGEVETYLYKLELTPSQQTDVKDLAYRCGTTVAMAEALKLWHQPNPFVATFGALLEILLDLRRGDVALKVCKIITDTLLD